MNLAEQIQFLQNKTDTITEAQAAIADQSSVLSADVLKSLVQYAKGRDVDGRLLQTNSQLFADYQAGVLAAIEGDHYRQIQAISKTLADQQAAMAILTNQLSSLRAYLQVGTAEELAAALAAGHTKPLTTAELEAAKARALERAKQAQAQHQTTTKP